MPTSGPPTPPTTIDPPATPAHVRLGVGGLLRTGPYRRLLGVRFATQWADGMFQAALGGAVLFNPERQADPLAVAAGLAVLLLPYSVIGPFAGALLDRWDRRRVLMGANLVRAALVVVVAAIVFTGVTGPPLYLAALTVAGVSRFVLSGLSVALPHVVPRRHLVEANTLAVTAGSATAALGGACAIGLRELVGPYDAGSATTTLDRRGRLAAGRRAGGALPAGQLSAPTARPASRRSGTAPRRASCTGSPTARGRRSPPRRWPRRSSRWRPTASRSA